VPLYRLDVIDFGRCITVEKEIEKIDGVPSPNVMFDESSNSYCILPSLASRQNISAFFLSNRCGF
jgi:hypothetical protein